MFFQVPVFDKLPNMLFNRIAIGIECRRNKCYADAAVFLCQLILVSFNDSFVGTVLNEIIAFFIQLKASVILQLDIVGYFCGYIGIQANREMEYCCTSYI